MIRMCFLYVFLLTIEAQKKGLDKNCQALFCLCFEYLYKRFVLPCISDPTGSTVKNQVRIPCLQRRY